MRLWVLISVKASFSFACARGVMDVSMLPGLFLLCFFATSDMMSNDITKAPRLYIVSDLKIGQDIILSQEHSHYLVNVLRRSEGDMLRLFNGRDGEFIAELVRPHKKATHVVVKTCLLSQPGLERCIHLYFAPIKKQRLDFLIEKAVELGATDLHPVITQNTENRNIKHARMQAQMIEAAEQCERLMVPKLHEMVSFDQILSKLNDSVLVALERGEYAALGHELKEVSISEPIRFFIGPEGGFTEDERASLLAHTHVKPVSLGHAILRAETACLKVLSLLD